MAPQLPANEHLDAESESREDRAFRVATSPYYTRIIDGLAPLQFAARSSNVTSDAMELMRFQDLVAQFNCKIYDVIRAEKAQISEARTNGNAVMLSSCTARLEENRHILRVSQSIGDGLAWRILGYDRPFLRLTSAPTRTLASVDLNTCYPGVRSVAMDLVQRNGSRVLVNDLTNVLRMGDLTEILPNGRILLHEIKGSGRFVKNILTVLKQAPTAKNSRQIENMLVAQLARDLRVISSDGQEIEIQTVGMKMPNHLDAVARLIRQARTHGYGQIAVGDYLVVQCTDFSVPGTKLLNTVKTVLQSPGTLSNWDDQDHIAPVSNWDMAFLEHFEFARNTTPYSVFPFSTRDCLDLTAGRLWLHSHVNLSAIERRFRVNGWIVDSHMDDAERAWVFEKPTTGPRPLLSRDSMPAFTISRGPYRVEVPFPLILRIGLDFVNPSVLVGLSEFEYKTAVVGESRSFDTMITGEREVWA